MDGPSLTVILVAAVFSIAISAVIYVLKRRYCVSLDAAEHAILRELQPSAPEIEIVEVEQVSDRGPFPWLDIDVGCTITNGILIDPDSTLYYRVRARDSAGQFTTWHAKIHATFRHIRRVQIRPP